MIYFWDTEADGFLEDATKIHCFSWKALGDDKVHSSKFDLDIFTEKGDTWIAHNQFGYDLPLMQKLGLINGFTADGIIGVDGSFVEMQFIDTLALSREWFPDLPRGHGLKPWSEYLGTYKPHIDDWHNLELEEYIQRCEEDVITTEQVFLYLADKLEIEI